MEGWCLKTWHDESNGDDIMACHGAIAVEVVYITLFSLYVGYLVVWSQVTSALSACTTRT